MVTLKSLLKNSKGVLFHSPKGTSEYAESGRRTVYQLFEEEIPVSWYQFSIDDLKTDESDYIYKSIKSTLNKNLEFDTAIFCCTPDVWYNHIDKFKIKFINKKMIGYPTWETDKFPDLWVKYCNSMDEIWVPSTFNKEIFEKCGVDVPIKVVPYPFIKKNLLEINSETLEKIVSISRWYGGENKIFKYGSDWKIYYTIGEWSDRKNIENTIQCFCKTFTSKDKVKFILKTYFEDYSKKNILYCIEKFESILKKFPDHPEFLLITEDIASQDILLIHSIGHCFVSLTRGEGFCLDAFDAFNYKKDVLITKFGGHCDYLGENYNGYIDFNLTNVIFKRKENVYNNDQKWAEAITDDFIEKIKSSVVKSTKELKIKSPITLDTGWYFQEQKNGNVYRQSSQKSSISVIDNSYDFIKLTVRYEIGNSTKNLSIITDSSIKRNFVLKKCFSEEILIPIKNIKRIEFITERSNLEKNRKDVRDLGFLLEKVSLIKENSIFEYSIDKIETIKELTDFYFLPHEDLSETFEKVSLFLEDGLKSYRSKISQLRIKTESEFQGITYIGQYGTSGYGTAAKGNLIHFFTKGVPVSWIPLYFDNSQLSDECYYNVIAKSLIKKPIERFDSVFFHSTPDLWPKLRDQYKTVIKDKKTIGYTVWETNKLPYLWVESINDCVDEVWCPSSYNELVFKNSGVKIPIKVFPHVFMPKELPSKKSVSIATLDGEILSNENSYYTFYNISELNPRKGVEDLVKTFCEAFSSKDKVRLILKVHYKNYDEKNKIYCITVLNNILSSFKDPPKIHIILNNLTEREILGLHSIGDCYISLCKSEGFGLTIFEAFKYDKKVITTGYGGQLDFLGRDYDGLVKYKLGNITGMEDFSKNYSEDQQWAYPDLEHARELMIESTK